jgi:tetratricopeptide (TPR) repeat protein
MASSLRRAVGSLIVVMVALMWSGPSCFAAEEKKTDSPFVNFANEDQIQELNKKIEALVAEGKYNDALPLAKKVADLAAESFGEDHIEYAKALNNLGWNQQTAGDYKSARTSFEKALKIYEKTYGSDSPRLSTSLNNLATLLCFQGDFDTALPLLERVLGAEVLVLGTNHKDLIYTLNNIAAVQSALGKQEECKRTLERALALPNVTDTEAKSQTLNNVALILQREGKLHSARKYLEQAVALREGASTARKTDMIEILTNLALVSYAMDEPDKAKKLLNQALGIARETVGEHHVDYATSLNNLAQIDYQTGDKVIARNAFLQVADVVDRQIENVLPAMSFAEQRAFLAGKVPLTISNLICCARDSASDVAPVYNHLFRWKGMLIESLRWQSALANVTQSDNAKELDELIAVRKQLAALFNKTWKDRFNVLSTRKSELERSMLSRAGYGRLTDVLGNMSLPDFLKLLRDDELLVDMYVYNEIGHPQDKRYAAFIADNGGQVSFVDVGPSSQIDQQVEAWRKQAMDRQPCTMELAVLKQSLFDKLAIDRRRQSKVFVSPEGDLARLPLNIFAVTAPGKYEMSQLDSPRELAYLRAGGTKHDTSASDKMLVVGGVDFGNTPGLFTFPSLPGTIKEAKAVMDIAGSNAIKCEYLTGRGAYKSKVLESLKRSGMAHLATHGIFSKHGFALTEIRLRLGGEEGQDTGKAAARNPLLTSSLVFAAAPNLDDDRPDLLSAEELIGNDLSKCNLIVLSACETGLGAKESGQGILGLRASMMAAGAKTLVMSLWKVPDVPTMILMQKFYENLLNNKQPPAVALTQAQIHVRTMEDGVFDDPVNWGLVGQGW